MIAPSSTLYKILDPIADAVNPILALAAIASIIIEWRRPARRSVLALAVATILGLAGIYIVAAVDRATHIWLKNGGDYSLHTAFATSVVVSLVAWRRRWATLLITILLGYLALIVMMGYHRVIDVITAVVIALAVTLPWHLRARRAVS